MGVEKNVPEIRFKGFSGQWDEKILGELVQLENGFAFQSKYFKKSPTEVIVLTPGSVNIGGGFQAGKGQYYDTKQEIPVRYVFRPNDMFITMTDLTLTAQALGYPAIIPKDNNTYLHNQRLGKLVGYKGDLWFLYNLLRTTKKQKEIVATSSGTTVKHTSPDKFLNRACFFPENEEQTQIGNTFQKLDALINQHQQKYDKLKQIKKAMLEKMFPKAGKTIPEIRFKGFSGEWEEHLLGDKMTVTSVKRILQSDWTASGVRFLRARDIVSSYKNEEPADYLYIAREKYEQYSQLSGKVEVGDLLVTGVGTIGVPMLITNEEPVYFKDGNIIWFKNENAINGLFLFYSFVGKQIQTYIKHSAGTGTVGTYTINSGKNTPIKLPKSEEQAAIGNYFQKLNTLINQQQQKITKLNNIKQACLSKMFV